MTPLALIATRKGLFQLDTDRKISPIDFLGVPVTALLATKQHDTWYAALDHGHFGVKLHRSVNAGKSWQEITAPTYPQIDNKDKDSGDSLKQIWSMAFADSNNPDSLWAGTIPGGLFSSIDGGQSWQLNQALWQFKNQHQWFGGGFDDPGIHSICIHPDNPKQIKVAISCGGVWVSEDAGETWQVKAKGLRAEYMPPEQTYDPYIQDPHLMVQCLSNPAHLWVQHHNGIFRSTDNSESWQEITDAPMSTFGFATAVDPNDPDTAWFVPAIKDECRIPVDQKLVVNRTSDGGKNFETLTSGLPQKNAYDLIYRHALDIDADGQCLIMGSTTGNLWISENRGDHWESLSNYLPPVYAVNFLK